MWPLYVPSQNCRFYLTRCQFGPSGASDAALSWGRAHWGASQTFRPPEVGALAFLTYYHCTVSCRFLWSFLPPVTLGSRPCLLEQNTAFSPPDVKQGCCFQIWVKHTRQRGLKTIKLTTVYALTGYFNIIYWLSPGLMYLGELLLWLQLIYHFCYCIWKIATTMALSK